MRILVEKQMPKLHDRRVTTCWQLAGLVSSVATYFDSDACTEASVRLFLFQVVLTTTYSSQSHLESEQRSNTGLTINLLNRVVL